LYRYIRLFYSFQRRNATSITKAFFLCLAYAPSFPSKVLGCGFSTVHFLLCKTTRGKNFWSLFFVADVTAE